MSTSYMVKTQIMPRGISSPLVLKAMEAVPRDMFVLESYRKLAFSDCPLPILEGQTISQPYMVAAMTELLNIGPQSKVLEIGTGSGYQTAVLAEICARVFTVEIIESLANGAATLLNKMGYKNIEFKLADGHLGWMEHAPYDAIIVTAAPEVLPPLLPDQLKRGCRLVIPVGPSTETQELRVIEKDEQGTLVSRSVMAVRFVPLVNGSRSQ